MDRAAPAHVLADRYETGPVIGRGGMAEVRSGRDLRLHRPVAIKLLRPELADEVGVRRRFEDEARAAARLSHPHLVPIYDTGEHEGLPYIVMECLPGRTLADEMAEGPLDEARAVEVTLQVLEALDAAHRAGVIHRDVKPGNVLLTASGEAKVTDFGIAKAEESRSTTSTGSLIGTPAYVAPERVAGEPATPQSDIYAVGVLLYEALTGQKPFGGDTPIAVLDAIRRAEAAPIRDRRPDVSATTARAVERAMQADPAQRFLTAADMITALHAGPSAAETATGDDATVLASPASATQVLRVDAPPAAASRGGVRPRRSAAPLAVAAVGALCLLVALVFLAARDGSDDAPRENTPPAGAEAELPPALDEAIDDLEREVQP